MKKQLANISRQLISLLCLSSILMVSNCQKNISHTPQAYFTKERKCKSTNSSTINEVILFCGNPGVGKSTLCNSIFGKAIFKSGSTLGRGMTTHEQGYMYEGKLYIDTPGLDDVELRQKAAEEIEAALKHNNNYKIVFVATLEAGRIRPADLVTINIFCDAIKTHFEYGIAFNKVTNQVIQKIEQEGISQYLTTLNKKPLSTIFIKKHTEMEDENDVCFDTASTETLLNFISELGANYIADTYVMKLDVRDYQEKIDEVEKKYKKEIAVLDSQLQQSKQQVKAMELHQEKSAQEIKNNKKILSQIEQQHKEQMEWLRLTQEKFIQEIESKDRELEQLRCEYKKKTERIRQHQNEYAQENEKKQIDTARIIQMHKEEAERQQSLIKLIEERNKQEIKSQLRETKRIMQLHKEEMEKTKRKIKQIDKQIELKQKHMEKEIEEQQSGIFNKIASLAFNFLEKVIQP